MRAVRWCSHWGEGGERGGGSLEGQKGCGWRGKEGCGFVDYARRDVTLPTYVAHISSCLAKID